MKHITDPQIVATYELQEGEQLMIAKRRIEDPNAKNAADFCHAYAYTPYKKPDPYRYLGAYVENNTIEQTISVPLTKKENAANESKEEIVPTTETLESTHTGTATIPRNESTRTPEIPLI